MRLRYLLRLTTALALSVAMLALAAGCKNINTGGGAVAAGPGGEAVIVGSPPGAGAVPFGVSVRPGTLGQTVWITAAGAAGAVAAAEMHHLEGLTGESAGQAETWKSTDPCQDEPDGLQIMGWTQTPPHNKNTWLDCGGWRRIMRTYGRQGGSLKNIQDRGYQVWECIAQVLAHGERSNTSLGTLFKMAFGKGSSKLAQVIVGSDGGVVSVSNEGGWRNCAKMAYY